MVHTTDGIQTRWERKSVLYYAGEPVRTFYGWSGHWEGYLLRDSVDVIFYRLGVVVFIMYSISARVSISADLCSTGEAVSILKHVPKQTRT